MYQVSKNVHDLLVNGGELSSIASTEQTLLLRSWRHDIDALSVARRSGKFGCLDAVALLGSNLLRQFGGDVAQLTSTIGTQVFTPHVQVNRVKYWCGDGKHFPQIDSLLRALSPSVPVDVHKGGDLNAELLYENHHT